MRLPDQYLYLPSRCIVFAHIVSSLIQILQCIRAELAEGSDGICANMIGMEIAIL